MKAAVCKWKPNKLATHQSMFNPTLTKLQNHSTTDDGNVDFRSLQKNHIQSLESKYKVVDLLVQKLLHDMTLDGCNLLLYMSGPSFKLIVYSDVERPWSYNQASVHYSKVKVSMAEDSDPVYTRRNWIDPIRRSQTSTDRIFRLYGNAWD